MNAKGLNQQLTNTSGIRIISLLIPCVTVATWLMPSSNSGLEKILSFFAPQKTSAETTLVVPTDVNSSASHAFYGKINDEMDANDIDCYDLPCLDPNCYDLDCFDPNCFNHNCFNDNCFDPNCFDPCDPNYFDPNCLNLNDPNYFNQNCLDFENPNYFDPNCFNLNDPCNFNPNCLNLEDANTFDPTCFDSIYIDETCINPESECFDINRPACILSENSWIMNISHGNGARFANIDSHWPPQDYGLYPNLDSNRVKNYTMRINSIETGLALTKTQIFADNNARFIFNGIGFHAWGNDHCVKIENTATGTYAFVGSIIEDVNDIKDANGQLIIEQENLNFPVKFAEAIKDTIYADLSGGAQLIVGGSWFNEEHEPNSVHLENLVDGTYVNLSRNIIEYSKTGVLVGKKIAGASALEITNPAILNILHNDFDGSGTGIDFNEPLYDVNGLVANNIFTNCGIGIEDYNNFSGTVTNNNFFNCTIPYTPPDNGGSALGILEQDPDGPINSFYNLDPSFQGEYVLSPLSEVVDLGVDIGWSYKGNGPDLGAKEGRDCSMLDLYVDNKIDFKDYAIFMNHWLETDGLPPIGDFSNNGEVYLEDLRYFPPCWCDSW
ncbi:MAG TPA: hypothetical protein VMX13_08100 [Sedimentisphaerales bacterium]|nr:hypothetical protein [Sedimentisphaerales bacterium]